MASILLVSLQRFRYFKYGIVSLWESCCWQKAFADCSLWSFMFSFFLQPLEAVAGRCSVKKSDLENFSKFTGKHLCQGLRPATLLKKRLWHKCFPVNFTKFLRTPFLREHLPWLLMNLSHHNVKCSSQWMDKIQIGMFLCYLSKIILIH